MNTKTYNIKSRTVGDGQHGTARWATNAQIKKTYKHLPFTLERWRKQVQKGKTAYWLYSCIEYACASGMSFLSTDTKGDVM